jgi:hypothetical protein
MYKILLLLLITPFWSSCAKELPPDQDIYVGTWHGFTSPYYPHYVLEIKKKGRASYTTEESRSSSAVTNGKVFISGTVLELGPKKFRIDSEPQVDPDGSVWMELDKIWYERD